MTVLIAGAGIGGLTLGLSLHAQGIPFKIVEAVAELRPMGVGINVQPHAAREIFELDLEVELDGVGLRTSEVVYYTSQGQKIWTEPRGLEAGYHWPQYSIHRGEFQIMLYRNLIKRAGPEVIQTGAALVDWTEDAHGIRIHLQDRKTGAALDDIHGEVLIACDGINSNARKKLYPDEGPAVWGGTIMWRGVTEAPRFLTGRSMAMAGVKSKKFVVYPMQDHGDGRMRLNWIADLERPADYPWNRQDWTREGRLSDFVPEFADWQFDWLNVPFLIENAESIWEYPMVDRDPLPQWSFGRVTLLGDAAHAMYPIGSNGASQAIIDARVLTRELMRHGRGPDALNAYEADRRDQVNALVLANRGDGPDKILEIVAERAPDGFTDIGDVMSPEELATVSAGYKSMAGFDVETLNARPSLLDM